MGQDVLSDGADHNLPTKVDTICLLSGNEIHYSSSHHRRDYGVLCNGSFTTVQGISTAATIGIRGNLGNVVSRTPARAGKSGTSVLAKRSL